MLLPVFFLLTTLVINHRLSGRLPDAENKSLHVLTGVVSSLPQKGMDSIRFDFEVDNAGDSIPDKLRVQWYTRPDRKPESTVPEVHAGERWRLQLELRTTRRRVNFSGVDQERWLFADGIGALAYVQPGKNTSKRAQVPCRIFRVTSLSAAMPISEVFSPLADC